MKLQHYFLIPLGIILLLGNSAGAAEAESPLAAQAEAVVGKHLIRFTQPPTRIPANVSVDAPLIGNGEMGVCVGGKPELQTFYLGRNDFWRLQHGYHFGYPCLLGKVVLSIPDLKDASYLVEQNLYDAITTGTFTKEKITVQYKTFVDASQDVWFLELSSNSEIHGTLQILPPDENDAKTVEGETRETNGNRITRAFEKADIPAKASAEINLVGDFTLKPNEPLQVRVSTTSNFKKNSATATPLSHRDWWHDFWQKSLVSIPDKEIERAYYQGLYTMAATSRNKDFPPGLFGVWITKEMPAWAGDYHLNYNFNAPFYALYSSNRIEQADTFNNPILAFMERGKFYSEKIAGNPDGVLYPVGIGPLGIETTRIVPGSSPNYEKPNNPNVEFQGLFWGQKSNASCQLTNVAMQFYYTWDKDYAKKMYPFVKAVAVFWEKYLKYEDGRYVIYNDAIHEGTVGNTNPILSLGFVKMVSQLAIDMSEYLGVDAERREKWAELRDKISPYPTMERNGKTVYRLSEKGPAWYDGNSLATQHIYPGCQVGVFSDPKELEIARETLIQKNCWFDNNSSNTHFPAAVRVGLPADLIMEKLRQYVERQYPNGFQRNNPHGVENCSTVPNTINEMLCTGHQGVVRLFPVWQREQDASFYNLRVEGAFLVSAELKNGKIQNVIIKSEQGRDLILLNPYEGQKIKIQNGNEEKIYEGERIKIPTKAGEIYRVLI